MDGFIGKLLPASLKAKIKQAMTHGIRAAFSAAKTVRVNGRLSFYAGPFMSAQNPASLLALFLCRFSSKAFFLPAHLRPTREF
jgi:hypothetical protein